MSTRMDMWTFREQTFSQTDLTGFGVEARDGGIGKIDEATYDVGGSFLIVDTGPWIFGKKVMLPASVVERVDFDTETVFIDRTKDEIKSAPEFDEARFRDESYRDEVGTYYGTGSPRGRVDEPLV
jgi:hypothetical protein